MLKNTKKKILKSLQHINKTPKGDAYPAVKWGPITAVVVTIVIFFVAQFVAIIVLGIYGGSKHWNQTTLNDWVNNSVSAQFFYSLIAEGLSVVILWRVLKKFGANFKTIGLGRARLRDLGYIIVGFIIYFVVLDIVTTILQNTDKHFNVNQQQAIGFHGAAGPELIIVAISLVILPPLVEEILFRGFLYSGLRKALPVVWAGLITSLLFATPHLFESSGGGLLWVAGIDTFVLSCVSVYIREKTNSLWGSIGLHALKNGLAFLALFVIH